MKALKRKPIKPLSIPPLQTLLVMDHVTAAMATMFRATYGLDYTSYRNAQDNIARIACIIRHREKNNIPLENLKEEFDQMVDRYEKEFGRLWA